MTIHLPSAFRLGRPLMSLLHAVQSKITEARASNSTAAKNMSLSIGSLLNGGVMVPAYADGADSPSSRREAL
jgi:hypothetical protein